MRERYEGQELAQHGFKLAGVYSECQRSHGMGVRIARYHNIDVEDIVASALCSNWMCRAASCRLCEVVKRCCGLSRGSMSSAHLLSCM